MILGIKIDLILEEVLREWKHVFLISPAKVRINSEISKYFSLFLSFVITSEGMSVALRTKIERKTSFPLAFYSLIRTFAS